MASKLFSSVQPSQSASLVFGLATAVLAVVGLLSVFLLALFDHPYRAVVLLGAGMLLAGVLRGVWPGRPWFSARNRWLDVTAYLVVGALLLYLAPWTAAIPPGTVPSG